MRLPRRLSDRRVTDENATRWLEGQEPRPRDGFTGLFLPTVGPALWDWYFPGRGLGAPKPLPRRRPRRCQQGEWLTDVAFWNTYVEQSAALRQAALADLPFLPQFLNLQTRANVLPATSPAAYACSDRSATVAQVLWNGDEWRLLSHNRY